ncbi:putative component of NuA3 histone acetyltransferase complex [Taxawa tesnikishii (nom. ined.)]|nr:putative component of NuA3 histone acetyltransferase complex [Dothideales sp. JES 119]
MKRKHDNFRNGLFDEEVLSQYTSEYAASEPYKHAVVSELISDSLLRDVRNEIIQNIHFTPKETDIYKIHQSGDLANLSGLDSSALKRLPSLLKLRDSLYSQEFRNWIGHVASVGPLSGKKTDMAVNVYVPGCHLLCHDDVIGSRRVSYILYLTNPDKPWQEAWGGALRLYPMKSIKGKDGQVAKVPTAEWSLSIPPAWNQMSFFAVQPGESFHDVEEVYKRKESESSDDGGRIRMAISGWFHIPQESEEGYVPGLEAKLVEKSSLQQLQGNPDRFDQPQQQWWDYSDTKVAHGAHKGDEEAALTEQDLEFLLKFMTPNYLTPDTVEELNELFAEESSLQLSNFLNKRFSEALKERIAAMDQGENGRKVSGVWKVAVPPHKHRYMFRHPRLGKATDDKSTGPYEELLDEFLPSLPFRKWLSLATGLDYTLATSHDQDDPQLEFCLNLTPMKGWGVDEEPEETEQDGASKDGKTNGEAKGKDKVKAAEAENTDEDDNVGGYEIYMAGDDADDEGDDGSDHGVSIPQGAANPSTTGAGNRRSSKQKKADPAIYQSSADDEDDGILFSNPAAWNTMSIVLRDKGVLKFVKYVSNAAKGDRWDMTGSFEVEDEDEDEDEEEDKEDGETAGGADENKDEDEEEWNGFED